ncbi:DUF2752 domain-containing protein [Auraticoccus sp. F435]|uniref:DUF2752 domain-containing protein n=1 Tax=Auraticoccus cholistanensis TaxID=2656650 RepID=A0A6A9USL2_9ACTN|nr:DUF2752 domain-containing protein [Auraticoccus cholistanensis]MVA75681.1 DUF2752 domain-containing protein [Auraticoccus cholistanensis]
MSTSAAAPHVADRRRAGRRLVWTGGVVAVGVATSALYRLTGLGFPCPWLALTGWQCPLCGGTRMGAALLRGDVAAAWSYNAVALLALGGLALLALVWLLQWSGARVPRVPRRATSVLAAVPDWGWTAGWVGALVLWTVLRNVL